MSRLKTIKRLMGTLLMGVLVSGCVAQTANVLNVQPARPVVAVDPNAVLPPPHLLQKDTLEALEHNRSQSRLAYVGVWAKDGDTCAMMDQTYFNGFAILTPDGLRTSQHLCTFAQGIPGSPTQNFAASCQTPDRKRSTPMIAISMMSSQALHLTMGKNQPGVDLVRCHLQPKVSTEP